MDYKELAKGLSEEALAKAKDGKTAEELLELAKQEGIELNDAQLEGIAGGSWSNCDTFLDCDCEFE